MEGITTPLILFLGFGLKLLAEGWFNSPLPGRGPNGPGWGVRSLGPWGAGSAPFPNKKVNGRALHQRGFRFPNLGFLGEISPWKGVFKWGLHFRF